MSHQPEPYTILSQPPVSSGVSKVRKVVAATLARWDKHELIDDATLCAAELATNAVLHTREPYDLVVRPAGAGVRIEVIDPRPELLPTPVPPSGSAIDITRSASTGRGLMIVAGVASRWGVTATAVAKSVWAEVAPAQTPPQPEPVVVIDGQTAPPLRPVSLVLRSLPVRASVMSSAQVDELVREVQLHPDETLVSAAERARLYELLDRSAHPRLVGRYTALRAAGRNHVRYDLELATNLDEVTAVEELSRLLELLPTRLDAGSASVPSEVADLRAWLSQEVASQIGGGAPAECRLAG